MRKKRLTKNGRTRTIPTAAGKWPRSWLRVETCPKMKAFILADLVGGRTPHFRREGGSTKWLQDLVWRTPRSSAIPNVFVDQTVGAISDDHFSFTKRNVPSVDIIDLDAAHDVPYWHTTQDTLDKISPKTLAITGHVILESIKELQKK